MFRYPSFLEEQSWTPLKAQTAFTMQRRFIARPSTMNSI